ncbi:hypothetical protein SMALB_6110 [Streptomyces malaysiensis]|uniref:Uncharacterized protein n=1 Tax=Streptomyces malaysiensis TaxID=92644 RepID=A0A7X6B0A2_STRMQ|nr:hypothetical protein [Streptomyces malaysiensis]
MTQLIPDTTGKTAQFRSEAGFDDMEYLPLMGWAIVIRVRPGQLPEVFFEPVVEDRCHGPIALGDLEEEVGPLTLLDIA